MTTDHLSIREDIAAHDAEVDEQLKRIMTQPKPRTPKVTIQSPNGIRSKPISKPVAAAAAVDTPPKTRRPSAEARRAALERKQF